MGGIESMSNTEIAHLVTMANDIAANLGLHADAEVRIADHLQHFWAPRMRKLLLDYVAGDGEALSQQLRGALEILQAKDGS